MGMSGAPDASLMRVGRDLTGVTGQQCTKNGCMSILTSHLSISIHVQVVPGLHGTAIHCLEVFTEDRR